MTKTSPLQLRDAPESLPDLAEQDLPAWMREYQRGWDWGLLAVVFLVLVVASPILLITGIPQSPVVQNQIAHTVEVVENLKAGVIYPRWAGDMTYGFGAPTLNYVPPLPHYLAAVYSALVEVEPVVGFKVLTASSLIILGLGMFSFVRGRWGAYAGTLSVATLMTGTPLVLGSTYLDGNLPALLAISLFCMALHSLDALNESSYGWRVPFAVFSVAGIWLADSPLNMALIVTICGWTLWTAALARSWRASAAPLGAIGLGTFLSAFYWLPAFAERNQVSWTSAQDWYPQAGYRNMAQVFESGFQLDLSTVNPVSPPGLGIAIHVLVILASAWTLARIWRAAPSPQYGARGDRIQQRLTTALSLMEPRQIAALFFLLAGFISIGLAIGPLYLAHSVGKGGRDSLADADLLLLAAVAWAVWIGQLGWLAQNTRRKWLGITIMIAASLSIAGSNLTSAVLPRWEAWFVPDSATSLARGGVRGYWTHPDNTILPTQLETPPAPSAALISSYEVNAIDKVQRNDLPAASRVDIIRHTPRSDLLAVNTPTPVKLTMLTLWFPGWQARIDDQPVPIQSDPETGLMWVRVPVGYHEVLFDFGTTPPRVASWVIAGLALLMTVSLALRKQHHGPEELRDSGPRVRYRSHEIAILLAVIAICTAGNLMTRAIPSHFTHESPPGVVEGNTTQLPRQLQGGIDLLAFQANEQIVVMPGENIEVTLFWRAVQPDLPDYQVDIRIIDESGNEASVVQRRHPAQIPTSQWTLWPLLTSHFRDSYSLPVHGNASAGTYRIVLTVGQCGQLSDGSCPSISPLFVRDARGSSLGREIVLPIEVIISD